MKNTPFDDFIAAAWADHADQPEVVAERLAASTGIVQTAAQVAPFAGLVVHVFGEHLGRWDRGMALLDTLRGSGPADGPAIAALARQRAALQAAAGDGSAIDALPTADAVAALASLSSMMGGRGDFDAAIAALSRALVIADQGLPEGAPAIRGLAVAGNNLAAALEDVKSGRSAEQTSAMVMAAEAGLKYWKLAGTWLEEERAEYRLARSLLQAGRAADAALAARRCIDICTRHDGPAFERVFGFAALALALRAAGDPAGFEAAREAAHRQHALVPVDEQPWCAADLREIDAT